MVHYNSIYPLTVKDLDTGHRTIEAHLRIRFPHAYILLQIVLKSSLLLCCWINVKVNNEFIVLVDAQGRDLLTPEGSVSTMDKYEAHRLGLLHRAVSVFLFDGCQLLLQKRAVDKYHSGGLWTNTCCTHPRLGESPLETSIRRLREEMGISCDLQELFQFSYFIQFAPDLYEHEYDHVFVGSWQGEPNPDPSEVEDWRWIDYWDLQQEIAQNPESFTYWLRVCLADVIQQVFPDQEERRCTKVAED